MIERKRPKKDNEDVERNAENSEEDDAMNGDTEINRDAEVNGGAEVNEDAETNEDSLSEETSDNLFMEGSFLHDEEEADWDDSHHVILVK